MVLVITSVFTANKNANATLSSIGVMNKNLLKNINNNFLPIFHL
jgi:hypothetical protein